MIEIKWLHQENEFEITLHVSKKLLMKKQVPVTPRLRDRKVVKESNFHTLFRTRVWKIQVALKSRLFWKCARTVLLKSSLSWNQGKILELPWNQGCFLYWTRNVSEPVFYNYCTPSKFQERFICIVMLFSRLTVRST